jgi:hypothetical protein
MSLLLIVEVLVQTKIAYKHNFEVKCSAHNKR